MQVLVVEDNRVLASVLHRGLSDAGHAVVQVGDGIAAVDAATCAEFDAIVLNVILPGLDGIEVARRLRQQSVEAPIVYLTARHALPDVVEGLNAGAMTT